MTIPESVNICGIKYPIKQLTEDEMHGKMGQWKTNPTCIKIMNEANNDMQAVTLIHEVIEAINWQLELDLKHRQICGLATSIYQVFKENNLRIRE